MTAFVTLFACTAPCSSARGQVEQPDAGASELVPPRVVFDPGVRYPDAAAPSAGERVVVELQLSLDAAGSVIDASVVSTPRAGFDQAALAAATRLQFEPARRGATALPSRMGYRYVFEPPAPPPPRKPEREAVSAAPAVTPKSPPAEPAAIEVTVHGERREPMAASYTRAEVRQIPGAFGDPFRAIETLPGVTPLASGLPFFYVRGAPPGNIAYFVDGVRVPYLYHVGVGPAVVQPTLIREVELHPGGYPARYGRAAGGVVAASTVDPETEAHGEGTLRLFDVGGMVETGFAGDRATAMVGGRYSYTGGLLSLAAPDLTLDYRDFQARASYDFTPRDTVSLFSFGAYDFLEDHADVLFASEFYRADARYDHHWDQGQVRSAVTVGYDRTRAVLLVPDDPRNLVDRSIAQRSELSHGLTPDLLLRAGMNGSLDFYAVEGALYVDPDLPEAAQVARLFPARTDFGAGAWLDVVWSPGIFELTPGVRIDLYGSGSKHALAVDPRLSARVHLGDCVRLVSALGIAHQGPSFVVPLPGLSPVLGKGLQRAMQTSVGTEVDFDDATTAGSNVFFNAFSNISDAFGTVGGGGDEELDLRSRGEAYGAELFLRRRLTAHLGGFVSYTLSRSVRRFGDRSFVSGFDRTHVANVALSYDLGRLWRAGARLLYYTGTPKWGEDQEGQDLDPIDVGSSDVEREPAYVRLDLRLEKRWVIGRDAWLSFVFEFLNATLDKETWPGGEQIGPVSVPSLGLEAGF
jgi:TonB family protein